MTKKILSFTLAAFFLLAAYSQSAVGNATLSLTKDKSNGLFVLNMKDPQGIKSFSLVFPTDKLPYSGDFGGCAANKKIDNITINDPSDFKPLMNAVILDCQGNETEFEISAPKDGIAQVKKTGIEPTPTPPPPPPASQGSAPPLASSEASGEGGDPLANIQYPIKDLGNCGSQETCKAYCEVSKNIERCIAFAEEHSLLSEKEIRKGKKFSEILKAGGTPGGCKTEKECRSYCSDTDKINECVEFAEKNGMMGEKDIEEAKKIRDIIKSGKSLPGNCKNRTACEAYCKNMEHMDECIAFAKEAGFMTEKEIAEAEKIMPLMKNGQTPGGCKSREECEAFCENEDNFQACFDFADKTGMISDKEREMMKKTGGKGPGGCRGRACQTYCDNPANQDACFQFAKDNGLVSEEDLKRMDEGKRMLKEQLESGSPEVQECLKSVMGGQNLEKEGFVGGAEIGEKMKECFEKMIPEGMGEQFQFGPNGDFSGPGGCKSREECETYCKDNPDACGFNMQGGGPPGEGGGGNFSGPGGCKSPEECRAYCQAHSNECQGFGNGDGDPGGEQRDGFSECGIVTGAVAKYVCGINGKGAIPGVETTYFNRCHAEQTDVQILHEGVCKEQDCSDIADPVCGNDGKSWVNDCHSEKYGGVKHKGVCTGEDHGDFPSPPNTGIDGTQQKICPAMPTVNECPQGTVKTKVFSSPECRDYYACAPEGTTLPTFTAPPSTAGETNIYPTGDYQQQYQGTQPTTNFSGPGGCKTAEECREYCTKNYTDPACQQFMPAGSSLPIQSPLALILWPFLELLK